MLLGQSPVQWFGIPSPQPEFLNIDIPRFACLAKIERANLDKSYPARQAFGNTLNKPGIYRTKKNETAFLKPRAVDMASYRREQFGENLGFIDNTIFAVLAKKKLFFSGDS